MVGAVDEEVGDYFPEFLDMLEESPFLKVRIRIISIIYILVEGGRTRGKTEIFSIVFSPNRMLSSLNV